MYLLGCLGYLLYYLLREYKWFGNQYQYQQIEIQKPEPQNFTTYVDRQWSKLHKSPFSETNW
jgi:hypothetical protein